MNSINDNGPLVSVIMATYNRANWLPRSIGSVLSQTYSNWELVIWNDGSSDQSEEVIKSFNDDRIRSYYDDNHGKSWAIDRAIELAKGRYIAIIDDDDEWHENKLDYQIKTMTRHPEVDVLFTDFNNQNLSTGVIGIGFEQNSKGLKSLSVEKIDSNIFLIIDQFPQGIVASNFILPSSTIIRKKVFDAVGLFNDKLRNGEDFELWWRIYLHGFLFAYINKILVNRTKPKGSLSSASINTYKNVIKGIDLCLVEANKHGRSDLNSLMKKPYRNAWLGILKAYAKSGQRKKAIYAFLNSLRYGINAKGLLFMLSALMGPYFISLVKKK